MRSTICVIIPIFNQDARRSVTPVMDDIARIGRKHPMMVMVFTNNFPLETGALAVAAKHRWDVVQASTTMPELQFRRWCYEKALSRSHLYFVQVDPYVVLHDRFFELAVQTWDSIESHPRSVLNLTGNGAFPKHRPFLRVQRGSTPGHTFITNPTGMQIIIETPVPPPATPVWVAEGCLVGAWGTFFQDGSDEPDPPPPPPPPEPITPEPEPVIPDPPPVVQSGGLKKAAFLVATHHRPDLLRNCLTLLQTQRIPAGWRMEIMVGGMTDDPGRTVAETMGVRYIVSPSPTVTSKLNIMLQSTDAQLVMKADDDDMQPPDRFTAAAEAFDRGADWSGVGAIYFYDLFADRIMQWTGKAEWGLIGTSMNYSTTLLRSVGGWPDRVKGEDGALATLFKPAHPTFIDVSDRMGMIVCVQHTANLYTRPAIDKGERATRGGFVINGLGPLADVELAPQIKTMLKPPKKKPVPRPIAVPAPQPVALPPAQPVVQQVKNPMPEIIRNVTVGIGICSYDRPKEVALWAGTLQKFIEQASQDQVTVIPVLSTCDPTPPADTINGIPCIHRTNLGVGWVKNNALRYLFERGCDYFFLLEDDCHVPTWDFFKKYIQVSQAAGIHHLMYGPIREWGTWTLTENTQTLEGFKFQEYRRKNDPQCTPGVITFHTRHALEMAGGLDMRFVGRGHAHKEWTERTFKIVGSPLPHPLWFLDIPENQQVTFARGPSRGFADKELIDRNYKLMATSTPNPCYDFLWADVEFPRGTGKKDLWTYLNGKFPYSLIEHEDVGPSGIDCDRRLFHRADVNHPLDPISICVSLKNRGDMLEGFIANIDASFEDHSLYEVVITDFQSDDCDVHKILKRIHTPHKIITMPGYFSRGKGLHMAALRARHPILMFFDIDMAVTSPLFWAWVRRYTSASQVMFPVCYGLHKDTPMEIKGSSRHPKHAHGYWREDGFGMCAMRRDTYLAIGGWDYRIARWGGEDNDLHWYCRNTPGVTVMRERSPYLFHRWHPIARAYKDQYGDPSQAPLSGVWKPPVERRSDRPNPADILKDIKG